MYPCLASFKPQGGEAIAVGADVSKREDLEALVKAATDKWGRLDVLVNNAGECPDLLMMRLYNARQLESHGFAVA